MTLLTLLQPQGGPLSYTLDVSAGTVTLTGQSVALQVTRSLAVAAGTVTTTGQSVALTVERTLAVTAGTVATTGQSVGLTVGGTVTYTMDVTPGTVSLAGQSVTLTVQRAARVSGGGDPRPRRARRRAPLPFQVPAAHALQVAPAVVRSFGGRAELHVERRLSASVAWEPWETVTDEMLESLLLVAVG